MKHHLPRVTTLRRELLLQHRKPLRRLATSHRVIVMKLTTDTARNPNNTPKMITQATMTSHRRRAHRPPTTSRNAFTTHPQHNRGQTFYDDDARLAAVCSRQRLTKQAKFRGLADENGRTTGTHRRTPRPKGAVRLYGHSLRTEKS